MGGQTPARIGARGGARRRERRERASGARRVVHPDDAAETARGRHETDETREKVSALRAVERSDCVGGLAACIDWEVEARGALS